MNSPISCWAQQLSQEAKEFWRMATQRSNGCNQVAAEFLVPKSDFLAQNPRIENLQQLSKRYKVSTLVILIRLRILKVIKASDFDKYQAEEKRIAEQKAVGGSSTAYYYRKINEASRQLCHAVISSTRAGKSHVQKSLRIVAGSRHHCLAENCRQSGCTTLVVLYLLDANAFIEPSNRWLSHHFCPAYWHWLIKMAKQNRLFSITDVRKEIKESKRATDERKWLTRWTRNEGSGLFKQPSYAAQHFTTVTKKIEEESIYTEDAITEFENSVDHYLIAEALAKKEENPVIVTQEVTNRQNDKRGKRIKSPPAVIKAVKLPDACEACGIQHMRVDEMLKAVSPQFILEQTSPS